MRFGQKIRLFGIQVKAFQRLESGGLQVRPPVTCIASCLNRPLFVCFCSVRPPPLPQRERYQEVFCTSRRRLRRGI